MRRSRGTILAVLLLAVVGCGDRHAPPPAAARPRTAPAGPMPVAASPIARAQRTAANVLHWPREPLAERAPNALVPVWSGVVMRLEFAFPERGIVAAGTGFVVQDRGGECYLLTCAHLIADREWRRRGTVAMRTMNRKRSIESWAFSVHIGTSANLSRVGRDGRPDLTRDLVIHPVLGTWPQPLRLAAADPVPGDWVWAVGREVRQPPGDEQLYLGRIVEVARGSYVLEKQADFDAHGFSGGPVVNARGEVVGNVVAGGGNRISGATVSTLRRRLREHGITVD